MFSRIHQRLGTAGFVLAIVALTAALAGTALAAALTGGQKNEVKKIATKVAKKYAGKDGAPGAPGPQGAKGDTGAKGGTGAKGDTGPEGKQGAAGTPGQDGENGFCSVSLPECKLPPGATMTGEWSFGVPKGGWSEVGDGESTLGPRVLTSISFPMHVGHDLENIRWVGLDAWLEPGEEYDRADCMGSINEPEAAPGFLCFYTEEMLNAGAGPKRRFCDSFNPLGDFGGITLVFCLKNPNEQASGHGSWAYTE